MSRIASVEAVEEAMGAIRASLPLGCDLDDRRTHVRAYERWVSKLDGRSCPSLSDFDAAIYGGPYSLLLDLRQSAIDPAIGHVGNALAEEAGISPGHTLATVPEQSLLRQLGSHYPMVVASGEPIAFEGEHEREGRRIMYRGILLPLAGYRGSIDYIHGLMSWREIVEIGMAADITFAVNRAVGGSSVPAPKALWALQDYMPVPPLRNQAELWLAV